MGRLILLFAITGAIFMSPVIGIITTNYLSKRLANETENPP